MMMPARSLRARLTLVFTLTTTGLMLLVTAGVLGYSAYAARQMADRVLAISVKRVRDELAEEHGLKSPVEMVREENELLERVGGAILVLDREGRLLAQSRRIVPRWPRGEGDGWRVAVVRAPDATVVIGYPWWKSEAALRGEAGLLIGLVLCVALFTTIGAWVLVGRTLLPIRVLARQADTASAAGLSVRLESPSEDAELVELVGTLNRLLEHLAQTAAARGRFYAAASHELRTPLQALSGHLELALTRPRTSDEYRTVVEEAYGQTRRFTRLVQELLLLNQLHQRTSTPASEPVDLAEALERILYQLRNAIAENRLRVAADLPERAVIHAPPAHVEMVLRNLVENAAKYAAPESIVSLRLGPAAGGWLFEIYNDCVGSLELRPDQVFEPFFRADTSRSSRTGGNGLGLAISRAAAEVNGWSLEWRCEARGVRALVGFPGPPEACAPDTSAAEGGLPCSAGVMASR